MKCGGSQRKFTPRAFHMIGMDKSNNDYNEIKGKFVVQGLQLRPMQSRLIYH